PTASTAIYTLSLHDALPICGEVIIFEIQAQLHLGLVLTVSQHSHGLLRLRQYGMHTYGRSKAVLAQRRSRHQQTQYLLHVIALRDRKSTRLNSSHVKISYAV